MPTGLAKFRSWWYYRRCGDKKIGSQLLAWAEEEARQAGAELTELSTNIKRRDAHRFYLREGYKQSHFRFTKAL